MLFYRSWSKIEQIVLTMLCKLTYLEASWTPIDELNRFFSSNGCNSSIDILWNNISTPQEAACHVFAHSWVTFDQLVPIFKTGIGQLKNGHLFMECPFCGDDWCVGGKREMNSWIRNQVGLEFIQIHIQGTIKSQWSWKWKIIIKYFKWIIICAYQWWRTQLGRSIGSSWCRLVVLHQVFWCRGHKLPHCRPWRHNRSVPKLYESSRRHCKARRLLWRLLELGKSQTPILLSCHNQPKVVPWAGKWSRNQFLHQMNGKSWNPGVQSSCPIVFGFYQGLGQWLPCQWCSVHGHNCWQHLLCQ